MRRFLPDRFANNPLSFANNFRTDIGVTHFFRDTEAFELLACEVIPKLFEGKTADDSVRACVVGCATGEEAYSIAILLSENAATITNAPSFKVFATDIDERGLEVARKGRYPASIVEHLSPERLERFFHQQDDAYQVKRELRELCLFTNHSFIKDPPREKCSFLPKGNPLAHQYCERKSCRGGKFHALPIEYAERHQGRQKNQ
jgi:two-component system, chemotaxis family, CheB/CheR fusion protein